MVSPTVYLLWCEVGANGLEFLKKGMLLSNTTKKGYSDLLRQELVEYVLCLIVYEYEFKVFWDKQISCLFLKAVS